jgi:hypothetical protein
MEREPDLAWDPLKVGRRVYERGASRRLETALVVGSPAAEPSGLQAVPGDRASLSRSTALFVPYLADDHCVAF